MTAILKVNELRKTFVQGFEEVEALKGVNLEVNEGEIFGFLGPNGSGKTTTLKCILGFLKPTSGEIQVFGDNLSVNGDLYKRIGYAPENTYFYDHLNGLEFLIFMGQLSGISRELSIERGLELLEKLGLLYAKDKFVKSYSKGMRQRLGLSASLINDPDLIFWDEPMSGLDPLGRILVKKLMVELKSKGKTLLFNTHVLPDVQEVSDRFAIIYLGKIVAESKTKSIKKPLEEYFKEVIDNEQQEHNII